MERCSTGVKKLTTLRCGARVRVRARARDGDGDGVEAKALELSSCRTVSRFYMILRNNSHRYRYRKYIQQQLCRYMAGSTYVYFRMKFCANLGRHPQIATKQIGQRAMANGLVHVLPKTQKTKRDIKTEKQKKNIQNNAKNT